VSSDPHLRIKLRVEIGLHRRQCLPVPLQPAHRTERLPDEMIMSATRFGLISPHDPFSLGAASDHFGLILGDNYPEAPQLDWEGPCSK
jgi:hypothetical protein